MVTQYYFQRFRNYQLLEILFGDFLCRLGFQQSSASVPLALRTKEAGPGQKGNLAQGLPRGGACGSVLSHVIGKWLLLLGHTGCVIYQRLLERAGVMREPASGRISTSQWLLCHLG